MVIMCDEFGEIEVAQGKFIFSDQLEVFTSWNSLNCERQDALKNYIEDITRKTEELKDLIASLPTDEGDVLFEETWPSSSEQ